MSSSGPLSSAEKYTLCRSIGEECIQDQELFNLLDKKPEIVAYDGFEPSGRMHIAQGVMKALNVNKLTKCGVHFKFWVADWYVRERRRVSAAGTYRVLVPRFFYSPRASRLSVRR